MRGHTLDDAAIRLDGISKRYRLRIAPHRSLADGLLDVGSRILDRAKGTPLKFPGL